MGVQAYQDLLRRYSMVLTHAWQRRKELDGAGRLSLEAQFLPAALALQETPVHPAPRIAMGLILAFAAIALVWAVFGRIEVVSTAAGHLIPDDRSKVVQPRESAVVRAIHVREGQAVRQDELLIELDATEAQADSAHVLSDLEAARLEAWRARALLDALETGRVSASSPDVATTDAARLDAERRLLAGEYAAYATRLGQIDAEIERRQAEEHATQELVGKLARTAPIARQRARDYQFLLDRNFVSRHGYLEREQAGIELESDLAAQQAKLAEVRAALREGQRQRGVLTAETRRQTLDRLHKAEQTAAGLAQELAKAENRRRHLRLTAPVDGTVQQLAVHTVGGVVTPAQPLLVVVPRGQPLEVEALVANKDIGFVHAGQAVQVKVETFPYTKYGTLAGMVSQVSSDAIQDEKLGLVYAARVRLDRHTIRAEGKSVNLSPGMAVTVEVKTGKRRVIEYFLSPLLQYQDESLRER